MKSRVVYQLSFVEQVFAMSSLSDVNTEAHLAQDRPVTCASTLWGRTTGK